MSSKCDYSSCIKPDELGNYIAIDTFNDMLVNTTNVANDFVQSYTQSQQQKVVSSDDNRYRISAEKQQREFIDAHNYIMKKANDEFTHLKSKLQGVENTKDLYRMLVKQNAALELAVKKTSNSVNISDRQSYYENKENDTVTWWANHFREKYWLLIFIMIVGIIISKRYKEYKLWGMTVFMILYPFLIMGVLGLILYLWNYIKKQTKWVYLYN